MGEPLTPDDQSSADPASQVPATGRLRPSRTVRLFYQLLAPCIGESQGHVLHDQSFLRFLGGGCGVDGDRSWISACSANVASNPMVSRNYALTPVIRQKASIDMSRSVFGNMSMPVTSSRMA